MQNICYFHVLLIAIRTLTENPSGMILEKKQAVLITGGSGLVGRYLTSALLSEGYNVSHLSRKADQFGKVRVFRWNPEMKILDPQVFEGIDYIIHLAGENIGAKRWTGNRKAVLLDSRVDSARLIHQVITAHGIKLKAFITASGSNYYGPATTDRIFTEDDLPGHDFLATICKKWEEAADLFSSSGIRTVKIRSGVVLEKTDSALSKMMEPARYGFLVQTGNGKQYMPWIHIKDLCNVYLKAVKDAEMTGPYNAVSTHQVTHRQFMETLSIVMKRRIFPIPVPAFLLRIILGEMADVILEGSRISSSKLCNQDFRFFYGNLRYALEDVLNY
jgi:uncharacterized protein